MEPLLAGLACDVVSQLAVPVRVDVGEIVTSVGRAHVADDTDELELKVCIVKRLGSLVLFVLGELRLILVFHHALGWNHRCLFVEESFGLFFVFLGIFSYSS